MQSTPLVTFVVGVRNMEATIGKCIDSLLNQDYPNTEIIIIDDGSDDRTPEVIREFRVKLITTEKKGISHARNLGYLQSKGEFIAYTDADCTIVTNWLSEIMPHFTDPNVAVVGGRIINQIDDQIPSLYRHNEIERRNIKTPDGEVNWAGGPGFIFRKNVLEEVGGFNPKWSHGEDAEISFMIIDKGYKIMKESQAITYHMPIQGYYKLIRNGYRDGVAYIRATFSHFRTSLQNTFNTTWYLPYDMVFQPILYALLIIGLPILFFLYFFLTWSIFLILSLIYIGILLFLFSYSFLPALDVVKLTPSHRNKIKFFWGAYLLHILRGFAWGLGLIIGIPLAIKFRLSS